MKFYATDITSIKKIEFEADSFGEAQLWVAENVIDASIHYIGLVDVPFYEWHKYWKGQNNE